MQIYDGNQKNGIIIAVFLHFLTTELQSTTNSTETSKIKMLYNRETVRNIEFIL